MQMLLWRAIKDAKESHLQEFDLGRSDPDDEGLIMFKDRLGATRSTLSYFRYPAGLGHLPSPFRATQQIRGLVSHVPRRLLTTGGKLLYRHFG